jgi:tetratricopeptide (TPR) repeat protein
MVCALLNPRDKLSGNLLALLFGLGAAVFYKGVSNLRLSRQYLAPNAEQLLQRDPRSPVVYLRPFDADDIDPVPPEPLAYHLGAGTFEETFGASEEEQLALAMNELGPFVAIGKPYDLLPKLGAARVRVSDQQWKAKVSEWVSRAQLIVLRLGFTKGVEWEIAHILEHAPPEKLVLLLPFTPATGYDTFRERMRECFQCDLPQIHRRNWTPPLSVCGLMYFSSGWEPHFVELERPRLNRISRTLDKIGRMWGIWILAAGPRSLVTVILFALQPRNWVTAQYKRAFRPVIRQLGLRWKRPAFLHLLKPFVVVTLLLGLLCFLYVKTVRQTRADTVQSLEREGGALTDLGDYDDAIQDFNAAIRINPKDKAAFLGRALAYEQENNYAAAIRDFSTVIQMDPKDKDGFFSRALAYEQENNYAAAIQDFSAVIAIVPENGLAWNNRCWLRAISGQLNDALSDCNHALGLQPDDALTLDSRGFVYLKMNKLDASIADYTAALGIDPELATSAFGRGVAEARKGNKAAGANGMNQGLRLDPDVGTKFAHWGVVPPTPSDSQRRR